MRSTRNHINNLLYCNGKIHMIHMYGVLGQWRFTYIHMYIGEHLWCMFLLQIQGLGKYLSKAASMAAYIFLIL
jgi:hypothetical protein